MLKEFIVSFKENLKKKSRNPFWGTFVVIWFLQNWVLIYSIFNFENSRSLKSRLEYIQSYFESNPILSTTFDTIWITFAVLIGSYILINISRLIVNFFEKVVTPWVYQITDRGSVVLKSDYEVMRNQVVELNDKLTQEIDKRIRIQDERDNFEEQLLEINSTPDQDENLSHIDKLANEIKEKDYLEKFDKIVGKISTNKSLSPNDEYDYFAKKGIIKFKNHGVGGDMFYSLTRVGEELRNRLL